MPLLHINDDEFETAIKENELILVDFYADWCGPCKMIAPVLEEIADSDRVIAKINTDENTTVVRQFGITSIPTLILFKNGEAIKRKEGFVPKAVIEALFAEEE